LKNLIFYSLLTMTSLMVNAMPPEARSLPLEQITLEHINIQGHVATWRLRKVCIDEQAYLVIIGANDPVGISASYKDGKPEQCRVHSIEEMSKD
jgi:hypothetical protein